MSPAIPVRRRYDGPMPAIAGIGLRSPHHRQLLDERPAVGWLEVHSENYFSGGGMPAHFLDRLRDHYPLSVHGVGLSLGSTDPLNEEHLKLLKRLIDRHEPQLVSEHLSWSSVGGRFLNDLLPLPYTDDALDHLVSRVVEVQDRLSRRILVENISAYLQYPHSTIPEHEFLIELANRSGCGILLDVNNVYVNARNHGLDARAYIRSIPGWFVQEIHLAGHTVNRVPGGEIVIDTHNQRVCREVWDLFEFAISLYGEKPTLIEWDTDVPPLEVLIGEMQIAGHLMERSHARVA